MTIIRLLSLVSGRRTGHEGEYLVEYNASIDGHDRLGVDIIAHIVTSPNVEEAKQFDTIGDAIWYARQIDARHPMRPDGRPNRPLTAFNMEFIGV